MKQVVLAVLLFFVSFSLSPAHAQKVISSAGTPVVENFDGFAGAGFAPSPGDGQLNSNEFAVTGLSDGDLAFGDTGTTGDYAQGTSTGGVGTGGIYAYDDGSDQWLFVQPTGTDFVPGTLTVRYQNNTGSTITEVDLSYDIKYYNDQDRSNTWNLRYSSNNVDYTTVTSQNFSTPDIADSSPTWQTVSRSTTITGLTVADGQFFYVRFHSTDVSGSGSRDEIGVDDISLTVTGTRDSDTDVEAPITQISGTSIASTVDTEAEAQDVFQFAIIDSGSDGEQTLVTNIRVKPGTSNTADWTDHIGGVTLTQDGTPVTIGSPAITDTTIDISIASGDLAVDDGVTSQIVLALYLTSGDTLSDGATLSFMIDGDDHGFTADPSGSTFATDLGPDIPSEDFTVDVTATQLAFSTVPDTVTVSSPFSAAVSAVDDNGNTDTDATNEVTLSLASGTGALTSSTGFVQNLSSGTFLWTDLQYDATDDFTLQASATGFPDATSNTITSESPSSEPNPGDLVISEFMANPAATGDATGEYVELYNKTDSPIDIQGFVLRDDGDDSHTINASGGSLVVPAGGFVTLARSATPGFTPDYVYSSFQLANTSADQIVLTTAGGTIIARATYTSSPPGGAGVAAELSDVFEPTNGVTDQSDYVAATTDLGNGDLGSPGAFGNTSNTISVTLDGPAGWRMLAPPAADLSVADLYNKNLVQGISGAPKYADWPEANLYIYNETGWVEPTYSTVFNPGQGFIWYFFGVKRVAETILLPFTLETTGTVPATTVEVDLNTTFTLTGNPFAKPIALDQLSTTGGSIQNVVQIWNPDAQSYVPLQVDEGDIVRRWQGFFVENNGATTLRIPPRANTTGGTFYGKTGADLQRRKLALRLVGRDAQDVEVTRDEAVQLYFHEQAGAGWDAWDASKLTPLADPYTTLAFVGTREGSEVLKMQESRAYDPVEGFEVPLALGTHNFSGPLTIDWPVWDNIPSTWQFTLTDLATDAVVDLRTAPSYTFAYEDPAGKTDAAGALAVRPSRLTVSAAPRFVLSVQPASATDRDDDALLPDRTTLAPNFPNPFGKATTFRYGLSEGAPVRLVVYDVLGREVAVLVDGTQPAGWHTAHWEAAVYPSGIYFGRLTAGGTTLSRKMLLVR